MQTISNDITIAQINRFICGPWLFCELRAYHSAAGGAGISKIAVFLFAIDSLYILMAETNFTLPGDRAYAAAACGKLSQEA
ncbi:hypothetical protein V2S89_21540 [Serratia sp. C2(2)]|nr:hypothetical protein [Serratia sp. C2(2)]